MVAPIQCCYRGCRLTVWAPVDGGLEVQRSSATCMSCRRVALCLPHFEAIFDSQRDLACPNCRDRKWFVRVPGGEPVAAALQVAVEASGGRVDIDSPPASAERPGPEAAWRWLRADRIPPDGRILDHGVLARVHVRGAALIVDGQTLDWICPTLPTGASRATSAALDLVVAHGADEARVLSWVSPEGSRLTLREPDGGALDRPTFLDARRFVYIRRVDGGDESLWEATIEQPGRVRQRRIASLGRGPHQPLAPVVVRQREAVVALAHDGDVCAPTWIRISDGRRTPLAAYGPPPRALVGAARGRRAAWIAHDGSVRTAGEHHPLQTIGRTAGRHIAVSADGRVVAWSDEDDGRPSLKTCDLQTAAVETHALRAPIGWIEPRLD